MAEVLETRRNGCPDCGGDLRRYADDPDTWVCRGCDHDHDDSEVFPNRTRDQME